MVFSDYEVPVARSMLMRAESLTESDDNLIETFTYYWVAFNNIYVMVAERSGKAPRLKKDSGGSLSTRTVGTVKIPRVSPVSERAQLDLAFQQFGNDLKRRLVEHPSTRFFAYRTPRWHDQPVETDIDGQSLNGVLNMGYTLGRDHPIWAPIDVGACECCCNGSADGRAWDAVASQILDLLYTVRNNLFHAGKVADDSSDRAVLKNALPLLKMIVESFVRTGRAA